MPYMPHLFYFEPCIQIILNRQSESVYYYFVRQGFRNFILIYVFQHYCWQGSYNGSVCAKKIKK